VPLVRKQETKMNPLNHYAIAPLLTSFTTFLLAAFVYFKNRKGKINRIFAFYYLAITVWSFCQGLLFYAQGPQDKSMALLWARLLHCGVFFIPTLFVHFILIFLDEIKRRKDVVVLGYLISFFLLLICPTELFIKDMLPKFSFRYIVEPGVLYLVCLLFFVGYVSYGLYKLFKAFHTFSGIRANQTKYLFWGSLLGYMGGSINFLWVFNIRLYPLNPFGIYTVPLYVFVVAYAIVTYRLMDITFEIRETTVRLASSLIPAAVFIAIGMAFFSPAVMIAMIVLTAIASPLLYRPLRRLLLPVILGGKYAYQQKLRRISDKWFSIFSLDRLSEALVKDVASSLGVKYCNFMIYDEEGKSYFVKANTGFKEGEETEEILFKEEGPLASYLKKEKTIAIKEVLKIQPPFSEHDPIVKEMDRVKAAISVPLYIGDELKGILNLGDKASREMYNRQDLEILSQLARDAEVMFRYSFFNYEQSLLVYRYSHDLRTPLDPVQTYLYLMQQGKLNEQEKQKYLAVVRKNIDFVAQGLSDMYQLSQMAYDHVRKKFVFGHFNITEMTKRIVEDFTGEAEKKDIYLRFTRKKQMPLAYGHEQSIERLIRNLIQNGIKFTDKGGVEVNVSSEKEDIKIKVSDTGPGIPRKDLPRIFNPFFKTKGRDQIVEGSGLGLTIVREIAALHGGEINVESEVGKGTVFTVLLPAYRRKKSD